MVKCRSIVRVYFGAHGLRFALLMQFVFDLMVLFEVYPMLNF